MTFDITPSRFFTDTSFYYAFLDKRDRFHSMAKEISDWMNIHNIGMTTTWEVVLETVTLLRYRHSYEAAMTFVKDVFPSIQIVTVSEEDRLEALHLFKKFSEDKKISLCDVISYLVVTKYFDHIPCLAFDDDFWALGLVPFQIP